MAYLLSDRLLRRIKSPFVAAVLIFWLSPFVNAAAQDAPSAVPQRPATVQALYDCRSIPDATQRLACFDARVAAMATAEANRDIVVADRDQLRRARRGLFGFSVGRLPIIGGAEENEQERAREPELTEIDTVITAVRSSQYKWSFTVEGGAVWVQTDSTSLPRDPQPGMKVHIRKAALGSYFAQIDGQRGIRVMRSR